MNKFTTSGYVRTYVGRQQAGRATVRDSSKLVAVKSIGDKGFSVTSY